MNDKSHFRNLAPLRRVGVLLTRPTSAPDIKALGSKARPFSLKLFLLVAGGVLGCGLNLHAQSSPTITLQPLSRTNLLGTAAKFNVTVDGTGPFTYQWRLNGTNLPKDIITTVAGNGSQGFSGDGGAATSAGLYYPQGVASDSSGNLFIADAYNRRIRKVDPSGIITTAAGNGSSSYSGDGVPAVSSGLAANGVAPAGGPRFCIAGGYRVLLVDASGLITNVAGNGSPGFTGDGAAATNASLNLADGVALDSSGSVYIADLYNNRVRKVDTNGIITTVAGNGSSPYSGDGGAATNAGVVGPTGVALDTVGNLYIADQSDNRVRKVDTNGIITTFAGGGPSLGDDGAATNARVLGPTGVTFDEFGNLYIADGGNNRVRKVDTNGIITTVAGTGSTGSSGDGGLATNARLWIPFGVALDISGDLYIADRNNNRVRKVWLSAGLPAFGLSQTTPANVGDYSVVVTSPYGSVTSQVATLSVVFPPTLTTQPISQFAAVGSSPTFSVAATGLGPLAYLWYFSGTNLLQSGTNTTLTLSNVSFADAGNYTVVVTNSYTSVTSRVATLTVGYPPSVTTQPSSLTNMAGTPALLNVAPGGTGPFIYQWRLNGTNLPNNLITTVAGNGSATFAGDGGVATNASLSLPQGVALGVSGAIYIADQNNRRVRRVDTNGVITSVAGGGSTLGDGGAATNASLGPLSGVALDAAGSLYVADPMPNCIRKVDTSGIINTVAGTGAFGYGGDGGPATSASFYGPSSVALDAWGNLYIADRVNCRVRKVAPGGIVTTVAGKSTSGYSGDGGPATNASLNYPSGVAADASGTVYIADSRNNRIRMMNTAGIITTVAGNGSAAYSGDGGMATNASLYLGTSDPSGVALDSSGNVYIADTSNNRIRKVDTNGIITTVAGGGSSYGDGGAATGASLHAPAGVALDLSGNLYIADQVHHRIRKVGLGGNPFLSLRRVGFADAGDYTVVISSPYASVTSAVATLTVTLPPPPQIVAGDTSFGAVSNRFGFNVTGVAGQSIVVEGSTNFVDWTSLFTNTTDGITPIYFCDPASTNFPWRFYRARSP